MSLLSRITYFIEKLRKQGSFTQQVSITLVIQVLSLVISIAHTAILARWLGREGKGLVTLALLVPSVLGLFLGMGINLASVYFIGTRKYSSSVISANAIGLIFPLSVVGVVAIVLLQILGRLEIWIPDIPLTLLFLALSTFPLTLASSYFSGILQGLQRISTVNALNLLQSVVLLVGDLILVVALNSGPYGAVFTYISSVLIKTIVSSYILKQLGVQLTPRWDLPVLKAMLQFGLKGHLGNVFQFFNYRLDVFLVNYFLNPAQVGVYSIATRLAELLWQLPNAVGFVILPKSAVTAPERMNRFTPKVFRITLALLCLGALVLAVFGKYAILWVYGTDFATAYPALLALLPGIVLLGSAKVLTNEIAGRGYPQYNSMTSGLAMLLTIFLDLTIIPLYGINGAAWASTIAYTGIFLLSGVFYLRISRQALTP